MTANMAICRAGIHTGSAANTAQHIPKFRGQHLGASVINNNQMKLFRAINVSCFARSCQPGVVSRQTCTNGTARQHGDQYIYLGKRGGDTLHTHHRNVRFRQRGTHSRITFISHQTYRTGFCHREITAGNTDFSTEEIFADLLANE